MIVSKRHKKTPYKTRVIRRIDRVSRDEWNNLFPPMREDYSFYKALDESSLEQFSLFYVLVYERRMLVGAAPCFILLRRKPRAFKPGDECAGCSRSIMRPTGFLLRRIPPSFDFAQDGALSFCRRTPTGEWKLRALARRASL